MKTAEKMLAVILIVIIAFGSISISSVAANAKPEHVGQIWITTDGKAKTLKLTWEKASNAKGYQIYRSTTGKAKSYQKVATVKSNSYTDAKLASSTT